MNALYLSTQFFFRRDLNVLSAMGEDSDRMTQILAVSRQTLHDTSPPPPIRLCDILTIPLIGSKFPLYPVGHSSSP